MGPRATGTPTSVSVRIKCPPGAKFVGIYHCLAPQEYVYTPGHGPLPAEEAYQYWLPNAEKHEADRLIELTLSHGGKLTVTPNHPILVHGHWLLAELIIPSERVTYQTRLPVEVQEGLPPLSYRTKKPSLLKHFPAIPEYMTPELAEFLGLIWSDGHIHKYGNGWGVAFGNTDTALLWRAHDLAENLFGLAGAWYKEKHVGAHQIHWSSTLLAHWLVDDLNFTKQRVPRVMWAADEFSRQAFLDGVIAGDGSTSPVSPSKPNNLVTAISTGAEHEPAVSLVYFCATLGIKARIRSMPQNWPQRNHDQMYQVSFQSGSHAVQVPKLLGAEQIVRDIETGQFSLGNKSGQQFIGGKTIADDVIWVRSVREIPGSVTVYDFHTPDQLLYAGSIPITTHNTHPGGIPQPSQQDLASGRAVGAKVLCIRVPETGVLKCYRRTK